MAYANVRISHWAKYSPRGARPPQLSFQQHSIRGGSDGYSQYPDWDSKIKRCRAVFLPEVSFGADAAAPLWQRERTSARNDALVRCLPELRDQPEAKSRRPYGPAWEWKTTNSAQTGSCLPNRVSQYPCPVRPGEKSPVYLMCLFIFGCQGTKNAIIYCSPVQQSIFLHTDDIRIVICFIDTDYLTLTVN